MHDQNIFNRFLTGLLGLSLSYITKCKNFQQYEQMLCYPTQYAIRPIDHIASSVHSAVNNL